MNYCCGFILSYASNLVLDNVFSGSDDDLIDSLLRRMERYTSNLEEIVEERTYQLAAEKKRSDELLYQILPQYVLVGKIDRCFSENL